MARRAEALPPESGPSLISILITDDPGMRRVNQSLFACADITDVISLRYEPVPGDPEGDHVEIIVNADCAIREGRCRHHHSLAAELALYLAHAFDHLSGEDDHTSGARARMRRRELIWLKDAAKRGLVHGLAEVHTPKKRKTTTTRRKASAAARRTGTHS